MVFLKCNFSVEEEKCTFLLTHEDPENMRFYCPKSKTNLKKIQNQSIDLLNLHSYDHQVNVRLLPVMRFL